MSGQGWKDMLYAYIAIGYNHGPEAHGGTKRQESNFLVAFPVSPLGFARCNCQGKYKDSIGNAAINIVESFASHFVPFLGPSPAALIGRPETSIQSQLWVP